MRSRLRGILIVLAAILTVAVATSFWAASRALRQATGSQRDARHLLFTEAPLQRFAPSNFEYISATSTFSTAAVFRNKLYLAGPAGLVAQGEQYRVGAELPPAQIKAMAVGLATTSTDPELWIATAGAGLLAFTGSGFRHVLPEAEAHRNLTAVLPLATGRILLGTDRAGVLVYDGHRLAPLHPALASLPISALAGDESELWIGTRDRGVVRWAGGQATTIAKLPDPHVLGIAAHAGKAFAATALGIAVIRGAEVERVREPAVTASTVHVFRNSLWVGTLEGTVLEIGLSSGKSRQFDSDSPAHSFVDAGDRLLAVTAKGLVDARTGAAIYKPNGALLSDRNISALSTDSQGRLWVGYFDRGLDVIDSGRTRTQHFEDENLFCVNRIVNTPDVNAVATANGLVMMDSRPSKRQVLTRDDGLIATHVTDIILDQGNMIAATPAGLTFVDRSGLRSLFALQGLVNNHAYALGYSEGTLLAGTLGGLSVLDGDTVRVNYTTGNSALKHNWIAAIRKHEGNWFVGTYGEGVMRLDEAGNWHSWPDMRSVEVNPNAMLSAGGKLYAGTLRQGLLQYSGGRWSRVQNGLPSLNVTALASDGDTILAGTDNGLVRIQ